MLPNPDEKLDPRVKRTRSLILTSLNLSSLKKDLNPSLFKM